MVLVRCIAVHLTVLANCIVTGIRCDIHERGQNIRFRGYSPESWRSP